MTIYVNPPAEDWAGLTERAGASDNGDIAARVEQIAGRVKCDGDRALRELTLEIEGREAGATFEVTEDEMDEAAAAVEPELAAAIETAARNIRIFHEAQRPQDVDLETSPGVRCVQRAVPIRRVGLYVPGGTAPLFSTVLMLAIPARVGLYVPGGTAPLFSTVLMLAIPARAAGCGEVILCTPADAHGKVAPAVLHAARLCGVDRVFKVGGAQAIAAMAYGTESIPRVDKIFGPGNRYVTYAKQLVSAADCAVDMPAGPSEVLVLADGTADPAFVAADMLSQAEHGADSQAIAVCLDAEFAATVRRETERQSASLPRREIAEKALENSRIIVLPTRSEAIAFANLYAAEHLIIQMIEPWSAARKITAAGSVFIGPWSPESAGDYASGTNHTLPTAGWARSHSGVNIDSFMRRITFQELTREGLENLSETITTMAQAEGLDGHANAVQLRIKN